MHGEIALHALFIFLYRYKNKGFLDQQNIPDDVNLKACEAADSESCVKYGDGFDRIDLTSYVRDGFYIKVFTK